MSDVEVIASSKINADALGAFINSFELSNHEWKQRGDVEEDEKDADKDEDEVWLLAELVEDVNIGDDMSALLIEDHRRRSCPLSARQRTDSSRGASHF